MVHNIISYKELEQKIRLLGIIFIFILFNKKYGWNYGREVIIWQLFLLEFL